VVPVLGLYAQTVQRLSEVTITYKHIVPVLVGLLDSDSLSKKTDPC